jgi:cell division protein FtsB
MKTINFNDNAHQYITELEAENERLQRKVNSLEDTCRILSYAKEQAQKDKPLADAIRTIIKEWKNYNC